MKAKVWVKILASAYGRGQGEIAEGRERYCVHAREMVAAGRSGFVETEFSFHLDEDVFPGQPADLRLLEVGDMILAEVDVGIRQNDGGGATSVTLEQVLLFPARLTSKNRGYYKHVARAMPELAQAVE